MHVLVGIGMVFWSAKSCSSMRIFAVGILSSARASNRFRMSTEACAAISSAMKIKDWEAANALAAHASVDILKRLDALALDNMPTAKKRIEEHAFALQKTIPLPAVSRPDMTSRRSSLRI